MSSVHQRVDRLTTGQRQAAVFLQQLPLLIGLDAANVAEAAAVQVVGVHLQRVKQPQQYLLLRGADAGLIVAHRRGGNAQAGGQLRAAQAQLLPPLLQLLTKTHGKRLLARFRQILSLS